MSGPWHPYCGPPPLPVDLFGRWNLDPTLLIAMTAIAGVHLLLLCRSGEWRQKRWPFAAAWSLMVLLFVSPFCALSSALFSVRVAHHVLLIAVVAPLIVLSLPSRWRAFSFSSAWLTGIFTAHFIILWAWHAPVAYAAALSDYLVFWVMQLSLLGAAVALWLAVLSPRIGLGGTLAMLLGNVIQMGLLGALITFARVPLYAPHFSSTAPFGLSALADQQLAGLIMWVPAVMPYLAAALALLSQHLARTSLADRVQ